MDCGWSTRSKHEEHEGNNQFLAEICITKALGAGALRADVRMIATPLTKVMP